MCILKVAEWLRRRLIGELAQAVSWMRPNIVEIAHLCVRKVRLSWLIVCREIIVHATRVRSASVLRRVTVGLCTVRFAFKM